MLYCISCIFYFYVLVYNILMVITTQENIAYGLSREEHNKPIIEHVFSLKLIHSKYKFSNFDWFDDIKNCVVEHKSFHLKYHTENITLLKTNKVLNGNSLFIFEFNYNNTFELFYLKYNSKLFLTFEQQYYKYANKLHYEQFFVIENKHLIPFNNDSIIDIKFKQKNNSIIENCIKNDAQKANY